MYVLHCFTKKTKQTPQKEIETARRCLRLVRKQVAKRKKEGKHEK
jgi:phage-related protein